MRFTITAFALLGGLMLGGPGQAQTTVSPSVAPKSPSAPVGHRQPRQTDVTPSQPATEPQPGTSGPDPTRPDPNEARLNRILNGICRGC